MFSVGLKREIAESVQRILQTVDHDELPGGEVQFLLHIDGLGRIFVIMAHQIRMFLRN